jgi:hypothetical protein
LTLKPPPWDHEAQPSNPTAAAMLRQAQHDMPLKGAGLLVLKPPPLCDVSRLRIVVATPLTATRYKKIGLL